MFFPLNLFQVMHEELALQWVMSGGAAREMAFLNSWFFLELMVCRYDIVS